MIIFTIIGVMIVVIMLVSFIMGYAGKPATPILNAIDKITGVNNPTYSTKEIYNELQDKIELTILNIENTENYQNQSITENSIKLARLLIDSEKYQVKIHAENEGKIHLSKVFSDLIEHKEMQINHERKIKDLSEFIEENFRDGINMEIIINNAKQMCVSYVRKYAQEAYKIQSVDKI